MFLIDLWNVYAQILDILNTFPYILYLIYLFICLYCNHLLLFEKALFVYLFYLFIRIYLFFFNRKSNADFPLADIY